MTSTTMPGTLKNAAPEDPRPPPGRDSPMVALAYNSRAAENIVIVQVAIVCLAISRAQRRQSPSHQLSAKIIIVRNVCLQASLQLGELLRAVDSKGAALYEGPAVQNAIRRYEASKPTVSNY